MNCQSVSGISFVAEMASKKLLETKESYTKIILSVKSDRTVRKKFSQYLTLFSRLVL